MNVPEPSSIFASGIALCGESPRRTADAELSLCFAFPTDGVSPEWLKMLPAGDVAGRDGRQWKNSQPDAVISAFKKNDIPLPFDFEHATELKASKGEKAPAAGWITELENRNGEIRGKADWNSTGLSAIQNKEYKFCSPAFFYDNQKKIVAFSSFGMTNKPNLDLTALNRENQKGDFVEELKLILAALALAETASQQDAVAAIDKLKQERETALNKQNSPPLNLFVPRADYDAAMNRATVAEQALLSSEKATFEAERDTVIADALTAGKITPASREYHLAQCRDQASLDEFKKFAGVRPVIAPKSGLDDKPPPDGTPALNRAEKRLCASLGLSEDDYKKSLKEVA